ncbi:hypothetical protein LY76DRAFT_129449 [Colletotrichum caudatum]|nr:hypothetical protein LY76DRAFT_129449 [Colletotrichum caudatum]
MSPYASPGYLLSTYPFHANLHIFTYSFKSNKCTQVFLLASVENAHPRLHPESISGIYSPRIVWFQWISDYIFMTVLHTSSTTTPITVISVSCAFNSLPAPSTLRCMGLLLGVGLCLTLILSGMALPAQRQATRHTSSSIIPPYHPRCAATYLLPTPLPCIYGSRDPRWIGVGVPIPIPPTHCFT